MAPSSQPDKESAKYGALGEDFVERVCNLAFIEDFVFRGPKYFRKKQEKELCDLLVLFGDACLIIQVKTADRRAHQNWSVDERVEWANEKIAEATSQIRGALRAVKKGFIRYVENKHVGRLDLGATPPKRFFSIAAIDHLPLSQMGHHPGVSFEGQDYPVIQLSFNELGSMLKELGSLPDLLEFLAFRQSFLVHSTFLGCTELDLLAAHQSQYPGIKDAIKSGLPIRLASDIWNKYNAMRRKATRDKERQPSELFDRLIREMRELVDIPSGIDEVKPRPASEPLGQSAMLVARYLNSFRRVERVDIANRLIQKSQLCEVTHKGRYFAVPLDADVLFLWYVCNEPRHTRREQLIALTRLAQIQYPTTLAVGIAMNSFTKPGISMAVDCVAHSMPDDFDWTTVSEEQRSIARDLFKPPVEGKLNEYRQWNHKPGFKHFKTRRHL
ncbi:MAG: hypothetical protein WC718_04100 [Phycisphaerales bacterium]|jgi:hypothetical protein